MEKVVDFAADNMYYVAQRLFLNFGSGKDETNIGRGI